MKYKFTSKENFSDFSSGKVINSIPGIPAFPIRLMSEVFQFCLSKRKQNNPVTIYDPCCGSAYHLTVLSFLHIDRINKIYCSDIDEKVLTIADKNLKLLTIDGINDRIQELKILFQRFHKNSHKDAYESAEKLKTILFKKKPHIDILKKSFSNNILNPSFPSELVETNIDLVFADIPYGKSTEWISRNNEVEEVWLLLENILKIINNQTLIAIAQTNKIPIEHESYVQIKKMKIGKRIIRIYKMKDFI
ncbi:MAG: hypothetical protein K8S23_02700 [Candidatus Cloacimonetes bacterium]|nr:hypothetical protein [Candidatus Cloacimonadota bacterium]